MLARACCSRLAPTVTVSRRIESVSRVMPMMTALELMTSTSMSCIALTSETPCPEGVSRTPA